MSPPESISLDTKKCRAARLILTWQRVGRAMGVRLWQIVDHVHRGGCCGRLLRRELPDGTVVVRCSACGEEAGSVDALCWCGIADVPKVNFRCIANPARSPQANDEIVGAEVTAP
jgi:hypothetical protein